MYAQVIVDIVHENVAHTFTYLIPEGLTLAPGQRVLVPFGPRRLEGIVLSLTEICDLPPEKVRPVAEALEPYPAVLPALIDLAARMAEEAHCPLAETLRLMLPAEMRGGRVRVKTVETVSLAVAREEAERAGIRVISRTSPMVPHSFRPSRDSGRSASMRGCESPSSVSVRMAARVISP